METQTETKQENKKINKNLPEYWFIKHDGSKLFVDEVIFYLNTTYLIEYYGRDFYKGSIDYKDWFYGFDGNKYTQGTNCCKYIHDLNNNSVKLTVEEFISLKNKNTEDVK